MWKQLSMVFLGGALADAADHEALRVEGTGQRSVLVVELFGIDVDPTLNAEAGKMVNRADRLDRTAVMTKQRPGRNRFLAKPTTEIAMRVSGEFAESDDVE